MGFEVEDIGDTPVEPDNGVEKIWALILRQILLKMVTK